MKCFFRYMFFLSIFLLPIDGLQGISFFGGISSYAFFYPSFLGMILYYIYCYHKRMKIIIPKGIEFYLLLLFIAYLPVTEILNCREIFLSAIKNERALLRTILPYMVLLFLFFLLPYYFNVVKDQKDIYIKIFRTLEIGFCFVGFYSFFQIISLFNISIGKTVVEIINPYISGIDMTNRLWRVNGLSFEASTCGVYFSFLFPWLIGFAFFINYSFRKMILCAYAIVIILFTFSRTAYVISLVEIILVIFLFKEKLFKGFSLKRRKVILFIIPMIFISIIMFMNFWIIKEYGFSFDSVYLSLVMEDNPSNIARIGTQIAAFNMFLEHPLIGVGYGQYTFHVVEYMPDWAYAAQEIVDRLSNIKMEDDVPVFSLYARILGETGILGIILWISLIVSMIYKFLNLRKKTTGTDREMINIMFTSFIGTILAFNNFDSFSLLGFWLTMVLLWVTERKVDRKEKLISNS